MTKNLNPKLRRHASGDRRFGHSDFEFLICFEFRASDFELILYSLTTYVHLLEPK